MSVPRRKIGMHRVVVFMMVGTIVGAVAASFIVPPVLGWYNEHGHPCQVVGAQIAMRDALLLTLGPERRFSGYTPRSGGFDPEARLVDLDSEGIDIAVLYPSVGLYFSDTDDVGLQAALCRGYN